MRALIAARNTKHQTIEALDHAIGYNGMTRALINAAEQRGRLPRADLITAYADELVDTSPLEVLLAFARDAGVGAEDTPTPLWRRVDELSAEQRGLIRDVVEIMLERFEHPS